jgi:hypothetical protein
MSPYGYERTLARLSRDVCFPLESGRAFREFRKSRNLSLVTAQKRTPNARAANVGF